MHDEEIYEEYKSDPHAGNGNHESERMINADREHIRRMNGFYGSEYDKKKEEYFRRKAKEEGHAGR